MFHLFHISTGPVFGASRNLVATTVKALDVRRDRNAAKESFPVLYGDCRRDSIARRSLSMMIARIRTSELVSMFALGGVG